MNSENTLRLQRFCGHEVYAVQKGEVFVNLPHEGELAILLNLEFHSGALIECTTPDDERGDEPSIEVNLPIPSLIASELVGKTVRVKKALDRARDTWNRIYVFEHEDLREIAATFVEATAEDCRLSLTARTQDPNHYDGSKPETIVKLEGWFPLAKLDEAAKSMARPPAPAKPASAKPASVRPASIKPTAAAVAAETPATEKRATRPSPRPVEPAKQTSTQQPTPTRAKQGSAKRPTPAKKTAQKLAPKPTPAKQTPPKKAPKKQPSKQVTAKKTARKLAPKPTPAKQAPPKKAPKKQPSKSTRQTPAKKRASKKAVPRKPARTATARKA